MRTQPGLSLNTHNFFLPPVPCSPLACSLTLPRNTQGMTVAAIEAVALQKLLRARRKASSSNSTTSCSTTTAAASNTNGSSCGSGSESVGTDGLQLQGLHRDLQKAVLPTIRCACVYVEGRVAFCALLVCVLVLQTARQADLQTPPPNTLLWLNPERQGYNLG